MNVLVAIEVYGKEFLTILHQMGISLAIGIFLYYVTGAVLYSYKICFQSNPIPEIRKRVLFVIAHPDDECMFFGPTIIRLRRTCDIYLLCLTKGNFRKRGYIRKRELWNSCIELGIPSENIMLMDARKMPDNPHIVWNFKYSSKVLLDYIHTMMFNEVYTFDFHGVSGHLNHSSVFYAFAYLCLDNKIPNYCKVYILETVNPQRKYSVFADALLSLISTHIFMITWDESNELRFAMRQHRSQMTWSRAFYMVLSRYVYINTYKEMDESDVQLVLQMTGFTALL